ncbi:hypothetical protein A0J61_04747 [Choanephora cucurbitarum]|uniref:Uncharacterized protein n=1 Tax=Choanephora cucurbitarum TaxID=101091 RepID=A0A1C7NF77_9FUNG|nr:hypothetical protein A0J61_04747 [Choanephora cucurbitarum]
MTIGFDDTNVAKYASSTSLVESRHSIQTSLFTYQRRVSFDNVASISPTFNSYTLKQSSQGFERTKRSRTFMVVIDLLRINSEENTKIQDPLIFTLMNLIDEGDEVVVVAVHSSFNYPYSDRDISPKQKAKEIMNWIVESHQGDNAIELTFGRPEVVLEEMV